MKARSSSTRRSPAQTRRRLLLWSPLAVFYAIAIVAAVLMLDASNFCSRLGGIHGVIQSNLTGAPTSASPPSRPTMLLGIFSTHAEVPRRQYIRDTMLNVSDDPRLCPLHSYLATSNTSSTVTDASLHCQVLYAFIVGGGGPTYANRNTQATNLSRIVLPPTDEYDEPDVVRLAIKENMNTGKSPTYFAYGALLDRELRGSSRHIDYVAKMDSDNLMNLRALGDFLNDYLVPFDAAQYRPTFGGMMFDWMYCGGHVHKHCNDLAGRVYMSGAFYFMSQHLARHVTSPDVDTQHFAKYEDMDMGMRVATFTQPVSYVEFNTGMFWRHGLKKEEAFRDWWNKGEEGNSTEAYWNGWGSWRKDGGGLG